MATMPEPEGESQVLRAVEEAAPDLGSLDQASQSQGRQPQSEEWVDVPPIDIDSQDPVDEPQGAGPSAPHPTAPPDVDIMPQVKRSKTIIQAAVLLTGVPMWGKYYHCWDVIDGKELLLDFTSFVHLGAQLTAKEYAGYPYYVVMYTPTSNAAKFEFGVHGEVSHMEKGGVIKEKEWAKIMKRAWPDNYPDSLGTLESAAQASTSAD